MILPLPSHRPPHRFYRGGAALARFRGITIDATHEPEDWVGSVTTVFGETELGLTRLADGSTLRSAIAADPLPWLGSAHVQRWGADPRLLVKLLDAGQRLPVHAHPSDAFSATHLGHAHGKAEAWYILTGGEVYLGLRTTVSAAELAGLVERQDTPTLLGLLHRITVSPGEVVWVPPGELHAIGAGVLLVELQQPEDLSILLEWEGFDLDGARDGHLGLGFDTALQAVNLMPRTPTALRTLIQPAPASGSVFPDASEEFFRLHRHQVTATTPTILERGFAIAVVVAGQIELNGEPCSAGSTALMTDAEGEVHLTGAGEVLIARPPAPSRSDH